MNNPRLAQRYAKSLVDIATELNQLDQVRNDALLLQQIMQSSRELVAVLNSPVIKSDKKFKILQAIAGDKISATTRAFIQLLCNKNRESNLDGIIASFLMQYNRIRGIHVATLTTATPISEQLVQSFVERIKSSSAIEHLTLNTEVDESLIGGFILEMEGKLIDASILRDLNDVKKQFANNDYIHKLR